MDRSVSPRSAPKPPAAPQAALVTLPERRHRVHTRMRLVVPAINAFTD